ncbi:hypothetical protein ACLMJK_002423 [Lecanora helva]
MAAPNKLRAIAPRPPTAQDPIFSDPVAQPSEHDELESDSSSNESGCSFISLNLYETKLQAEDTRATSKKAKGKARESRDDGSDEDDDASDVAGHEQITPKKRKAEEIDLLTDEDAEGDTDVEYFESQRKAQGKVRLSSEDTDAEEDIDEDTESTVYHWQIWNQLVKYASSNGRYSYVHEPKHGDNPMDVTAFEATQATWGPQRADRPQILSQWKQTPANPSRDIPKTLRFNGHKILDWKGRAVRAFPCLPLTISSGVGGFRVEAWMRTDSRILYQDIEARMWTKVTAEGREPKIGRRALASRCSNFRDRAGCITWSRAKRAENLSHAYMDSLRTEYQKANNLTTDKDLTYAQKAEFYSLTRAGFNKSGEAPGASTSTSRAVSPTPQRRSRQRLQRENELEEEDTSSEESTESQESSEGKESRISGVLPSDPEDPTDSRNDIPTTEEEAMELQRALEPTITHFQQLTGNMLPDRADHRDNYLSQWSMYQTQFETIWREMGNTSEPPTLRGLDRWTGGINNWEDAQFAQPV